MPAGLEQVVSACLVKDPLGRIQTAANLLSRLRPFASSSNAEPAVILTARPSSSTPRTVQMSPRDPTYGGMLPSTPLEHHTIKEDEEETTLVKQRG